MKKFKCPKCHKKPNIQVEVWGWHVGEICKNIIGTKSWLFGLLKTPKYCNYIFSMDEEN